MLAAVVGGSLQGIEAVYLSHKAGWNVRLIDKNPKAPASGLCEQFIQWDVTEKTQVKTAFEGVDLVIPALENTQALKALHAWTGASSIPFAFDPAAYRISSSKIKSNRLFLENHIPMPRPYPECPFPVVAKPDQGSGSHGVKIFFGEQDLKNFMEETHEDHVTQEFLGGGFYSIEVLGTPERYAPLQITRLEMDENHDCKRVVAPAGLSDPLTSDFESVAVNLARSVKLGGLMDVEAVLDGNQLKVLEIDARLPSQTPTAVFWSTGINMLQVLKDIFMQQRFVVMANSFGAHAVIYEHINVSHDTIQVTGEGLMASAESLHIESPFFGADEAITNFKPGRTRWVATLIFCEKDLDSVWGKRNRAIRDIMRLLKIDTYRDNAPRVREKTVPS